MSYALLREIVEDAKQTHTYVTVLQFPSINEKLKLLGKIAYKDFMQLEFANFQNIYF